MSERRWVAVEEKPKRLKTNYMGKVKIITKEKEEEKKETTEKAPEVVSKQEVKIPKKKIVLSDKEGNTIFWTSAGALGFKGAKKGTPFAASKAASVIGEKAKALGVKEVDVVVKGVGSGREPTIRAFMAYDIDITGVRDMTPVPHNGPKPKKPRRV